MHYWTSHHPYVVPAAVHARADASRTRWRSSTSTRPCSPRSPARRARPRVVRTAPAPPDACTTRTTTTSTTPTAGPSPGGRTSASTSSDPDIGRLRSRLSVLGLIVNPVAGDRRSGRASRAATGPTVQRTARAARRRAARRGAGARRARARRGGVRRARRVLTASAADGRGRRAPQAGSTRVVVCASARADHDRRRHAAAARASRTRVRTSLLFAGGDGTARDVAAALRRTSPALGIPAGVKMYSPVFAVSPPAAGARRRRMARRPRAGAAARAEREVLDVDEEQLRRVRVEPRLFGTLAVPHRPGRTQARKAATPAGEAGGRPSEPPAQRHPRCEPGVRYLLGPGGTMTRARAAARRAEEPARRRRRARRPDRASRASEAELSTRSAAARPRPSSR